MVADDGGRFGTWRRDRDRWGFDLHPLSVLATEPDLVLPAGGAAAIWHQVANATLTATAHAGGATTVYATDRGVVRLTGDDVRWGLDGMLDGPVGPVLDLRARWELGAAVWSGRLTGGDDGEGGVEVERRVAVAPGRDPVLRIDVALRGAPGALAGRRWAERWPVVPWPLVLGGLMSPNVAPPSDYAARERLAWRSLYTTSAVVRRLTDGYRAAFASACRTRAMVRPDLAALVHEPRRAVPWVGSDPAGATPADRRSDAVGEPPAWLDLRLPRVVLASLDGAERVVALDPATATVAVELDGRPEQHLSFVLALAGTAPVPGGAGGGAQRVGADPVAAVLDRARGVTLDAAASAWSSLLVLSGTGDETVEREAGWHAGHLVGEETEDAHFGRRFVAQGSAYQFVHGLHGAPRDYCIYAVPLAFVDPAAAREQLEVVLRMTRPSGRMHYAHTGRGRCTSGGIHAAPTDLPLFLLWALTEYVWTTGDHAFLDAVVPFEPAGEAGASTVRERALLAWRYVRDRVGLGAHGMLRVGSGDWADPISAMVPDRRAFHEHGESGFNTAFAAFVLPRAADLLAPTHPDDAEEARAYAVGLAAAMDDAWTGRWYLRGWDGTGGPVGRDHLFVDGQVWCLIGDRGDAATRAALVEQIAERCEDPSPIGATILDRPHPNRLGMLAPGWDCNGGVWAAVNGLLTWGWARHAPERAWPSVRRQSLAAHAGAYPALWYGIWSGPDAYNGWFGEQAGATFVQPATPMQEFPVMNANAHAGPLLGLLRALGIETADGGLVVRPGAGPAGWALRTPAFEVDAAGARPRNAAEPA